MKGLVIAICVLLGLSHLMLEAGAGMQILNDYEKVYVNPFWSPSYHWYYPEGISLYHWVQLNAVEMMICTIFFCFAKVSYQYSYRLFLIGIIWFVYHLIDWFMLWWDYKTSVLFYWFLNITIALTISSLFVPERKQGVVKSIN